MKRVARDGKCEIILAKNKALATLADELSMLIKHQARRLDGSIQLVRESQEEIVMQDARIKILCSQIGAAGHRRDT